MDQYSGIGGSLQTVGQGEDAGGAGEVMDQCSGTGEVVRAGAGMIATSAGYGTPTATIIDNSITFIAVGNGVKRKHNHPFCKTGFKDRDLSGEIKIISPESHVLYQENCYACWVHDYASRNSVKFQYSTDPWGVGGTIARSIKRNATNKMCGS